MSHSFSEDTFFNGALRVRQSRSGYRFSIDAVLLAGYATGHIRPETPTSIVDLGTGCGIIPLILAYRHDRVSITGVEIQPPLARLAAENVRINHLADRITILCRDMTSGDPSTPAGQADLVISNPPFRKTLSGRINANSERALARHEIESTVEDVIDTAVRLLRVSGKFAVVYPASRLTDIMTTMRQAGLEPKQVRLVHSRETEAAKLVLIQGLKHGRPGLTVEPPLIVYLPDGGYTEEVRAMFQP
ncbi:MAG: tRNA1(Val) (adenine(37)-N6)-methyltransferase [Desulfosudaceae bacterium]